MSNENGSAEVISDQEHAQGSTAAVRTSADELMEEMRDVGRRLPPCAVKDLLSSGVCVRCIFRLFGIRGRIYSYSFLSPLNLVLALGEPTDSDKYSVRANKDSESFHAFEDSESEAAICCICLGILQFTYRDDKEILVNRDSALDLAGLIADAVKQEGCLFDKFSLEVSVPPVILENDHAAWLYLKRKYESEHWIQEKLLSISAKEALKFSLLGPLETLLDVQPGLSSFRIRLTFSPFKASKGAQSLTENIDGCKRQRLGTGEAFSSCVDYADISTNEADELIERSLEESQTREFPPEKVNEPCCFSISCSRTPIIFGGRYLKYSRNVSQTRWIIDDERMGEASVEEIIGGSILPMCRADNYKFHAAGREDIDVRMLGSGRPFLVEIQNARHFPSEMSIKEIEAQINNSEIKLVRVKNLKVLGSQGWTLMREGEAEKQKQYAALVWISRSLEDADMQTVSSLKDMPILQRTPIRVLHRRSPLEREKTIHWMKIERITGSSQYFLLHLSTQAGTYIKEFVHGDLGRTHPSIGSILGCRAEILQLDVTDVKMDCFLTD